MATPLDLRNRRREAQRAVRLALNAVHAALDDWKAAVADGKHAATALTNAALTQLHLPALPLGALADVPGLRPAAAAKLAAQQAAALADLSGCLERLTAVVAALEAAAAGLQELAQREAEAPLLGEGAVFAALPLHLLGRMLCEVAVQHRAELAVKEGVVGGFTLVLGELPVADQPGGSDGGTGRAAAAREERLRRSMQVHVAAWMLSAEVDDPRVDGHLAAVAAEMKGF